MRLLRWPDRSCAFCLLAVDLGNCATVRHLRIFIREPALTFYIYTTSSSSGLLSSSPNPMSAQIGPPGSSTSPSAPPAGPSRGSSLGGVQHGDEVSRVSRVSLATMTSFAMNTMISQVLEAVGQCAVVRAHHGEQELPSRPGPETEKQSAGINRKEQTALYNGGFF